MYALEPKKRRKNKKSATYKLDISRDPRVQHILAHTPKKHFREGSQEKRHASRYECEYEFVDEEGHEGAFSVVREVEVVECRLGRWGRGYGTGGEEAPVAVFLDEVFYVRACVSWDAEE